MPCKEGYAWDWSADPRSRIKQKNKKEKPERPGKSPGKGSGSQGPDHGEREVGKPSKSGRRLHISSGENSARRGGNENTATTLWGRGGGYN